MWPFRRSGIPTYEVDNIIGEGTTVRGDLRGPGGFRVDGLVTGSVEADGPIVIGEKGAVEGTVTGRDVIVLGRVHGNVTAKAHLEVGPAGRVIGDVEVVSIKVHAGGAFHGQSRIGEAAVNASLSPDTKSFGILPVSNAPAPFSHKAKSGRTLPPPLGAVPPPPPTAVGSQPKLPVVTPSAPTTTAPMPATAPAVSTIERIAPRESGEAPKAVND